MIRIHAMAGAAALGLTLSAQAAGAAEVNVYTYREQPLIQPVFDLFTKETGIKVNVVFSNKGLEERIKAEGAVSPADLFVTADVALLAKARDMGLLQPIHSKLVEQAVPDHFRDPNGMWVGTTYRARVIYASRERISETSMSYDDLTDPKWKGKVCTRSGQHAYNVALLAGMIVREGEAQAEKWIGGLKANLAQKPSGNDRSQAKDIFSGKCDLALGNTYYYGLMATADKEPEQKDWAKAIKIIFPTYKDGGTHTNISGVGLVKTAPNKAAAMKLIEFMVGDEAQKIYAAANFEYPVREGTDVAPLIKGLGTFTPDKMDLNDMARQRAKASELIDKVGYDDGPAG